MHLPYLTRVPALTGWGKGGNVTSAGWQVILCDPIWHVSSRSGQACGETAISGYFTLLNFTFYVFIALYRVPSSVCRPRRVTKGICTSLTVCALASRPLVRVSDSAAAKRSACSSSWPTSIATARPRPRRAPADSAAPTTSSSAVARDAAGVANDQHPQP